MGRITSNQRLGKRAIYMVSAWATENELVLGQRKVDEKPNEITAIPELLKMLALSGSIITIDAIGTQTHIAQTIIAAEADYVLSPNCITGKVTMGSNVASGKMLPSDRRKCQSEEPHDEPEKQARIVRSFATQIPKSKEG